MKLYQIRSCDTCRAARKALAHLDVEFCDLRDPAPDSQVIGRWLRLVGPEKLINRRSATWRGLEAAERGRDPVELLMAHPTLIKRPVIDLGREVLVGWDAAVQKRVMKG